MVVFLVVLVLASQLLDAPLVVLVQLHLLWLCSQLQRFASLATLQMNLESLWQESSAAMRTRFKLLFFNLLFELKGA